MIPPESHDLFQALVRGSHPILLTTHMQPDGDAIGSQQGLARFLHDQGAEVRLINADPTPDVLRFAEDPAFDVEVYDPSRHHAALAAAGLIVLVDNSAPDRLGRMEAPLVGSADRVLCIDHHPGRAAPWRYNVVDVPACATAVMIYELTRACGWAPGRAAAQALYLGLATDTGFFRFNSTSARAHRIAADLLDLGAEPARAYQAIHERNSEAYTRLLGHALSGLVLEADGRLAAVTLRRDLLRSLHAEELDVAEITTALLAIDGVVVALLFRELTGERVKVSLRSKGAIDVHLLATQFGGGGHRNASGIVLPGPLDGVVTALLGRAVDLVLAAPPR